MLLRTWLDKQGYGAQARLARRIDANQEDLAGWLAGRRPMPTHRAVEIEFATRGEVRAEELLPEVVWVRVRQKGWPWGGKPMVDVAATKQVA